ncbi:MAG: putative photosynthetic complex assembly protein PuhE [Pseudomonadota bacterium]
MASPWIAAAIAVFAWWASTGAILVMVRRTDRVGQNLWAVLATLPLMVFGIVAFIQSAGQMTPGAAYLAFAAALAIWGWIELAFLTGIIAGPNRTPLRKGVPEWERFVRAWGTVAYHEMTLTAALIGLAVLAHGQPNRFGFWTFAILYAARISAKLNLYLGVRKVNTQFIPRSLIHLPSHFREARVNWLVPTSVTLLSFAAFSWMERIVQAPTAFEAVGFALLAALVALALLEHWFMVVRLPDEKLWQWMLPTNTTRETLEEGPNAVR